MTSVFSEVHRGHGAVGTHNKPPMRAVLRRNTVCAAPEIRIWSVNADMRTRLPQSNLFETNASLSDVIASEL
jgi:hypothetical protein